MGDVAGVEEIVWALLLAIRHTSSTLNSWPVVDELAVVAVVREASGANVLSVTVKNGVGASGQKKHQRSTIVIVIVRWINRFMAKVSRGGEVDASDFLPRI